MKVLFIINGLSNSGGTERVASTLANLFQEKLNYNITIVNRLSNVDNIFFPLNKNINVIHLSGGYFTFYIKLRRFLKYNYFDKIIVHNMGKLSFLCSNLYLPNLKMVSLEHASFNSYPLWVRLLSKVWLSKFGAIVVLTESDKLNYIKKHPYVIKIENISAYNVINISPSYSSQSRRIIAIGRLSYQKNFKALLAAWKLVSEKYKNFNWSLSIYGDGEEKRELEDFISNEQISNVSLRGIREDLSSIYSNASFLVMSSRYEGLGLVLIEAQSFGLPLISFDCPYGPAEVISHNENGILVENGNINALAEAIMELIESEDKRNSFSNNAKQAAEKYSEGNILDKWLNNIFLS